MESIPDRSALRRLFSFLKESDYAQVSRVPTLRRPFWLLPLEVSVLTGFLRGHTTPFSPTVLPWFYRLAGISASSGARTLFDLFFMMNEIEQSRIAELTGAELLEEMIGSNVLQREGGYLRSNYRMVPWDGSIFLSDPDQGDSRTTMHYVYIGGDSVLLSKTVKHHLTDRRYGRGLDLCTGTGIQAHGLLKVCDEVIASEYNHRAVEFAKATQFANGIGDELEIIQSDVWENVNGSFDIIVSNTPYYPVSEERRSATIMDVCGGDEHGMEIPLAIFSGFSEYLNEGGRAAILAASPVIRGEDTFRSRIIPIASDSGLETLLVPWKVTNIRLEPDYQVRNHIDYMIHYIVLAEKTGNGSVGTAGYGRFRSLFEHLQVRAQKLLPSWPKG